MGSFSRCLSKPSQVLASGQTLWIWYLHGWLAGELIGWIFSDVAREYLMVVRSTLWATDRENNGTNIVGS